MNQSTLKPFERKNIYILTIAFYYKFLVRNFFGSLSRQLQLTSVSLFGNMMYRTRRGGGRTWRFWKRSNIATLWEKDNPYDNIVIWTRNFFTASSDYQNWRNCDSFLNYMSCKARACSHCRNIKHFNETLHLSRWLGYETTLF